MEEDKMPKTEEGWKACLAPEQYEVLRRKGTEAPFMGKYYKNKETGMYVCGACGQELFSSETKFDSGTGWPSFTDPVNLENVELKKDTSHGMTRTEVMCKKCGSHLGHVFDDGPTKIDNNTLASGKRYCINSMALDFKKADK
ncbi:MAG: peptide-methionine (R)-S-oxide reductase [Candidatus Yanofskybacteria bacterium RIFCSPHIGHO2_02_FULL_41_11]|uniref:Peptide methionine sulfoxide reductase MsrB n=1 Tax=Candidatus Yanofskybacteria bacterium RIFCSPHIGHO2_02_FULL_41_11 TaxID=1802675 RepID=A0A1F8F782_9BACT|nr:MAG: peptide-methionine (R)-S-oxide reductase [Candidatus Yanofskybacteria bacterium RIFCSPHIGHO2_02_FULL_41_11]